ncbi:hypothetical protein BJY21_000507 [Kineosphaera limosa]|uniref:Copper chaperone PCu(A)C n=1 Tax=Kineosphaera limosa NBRC 100340 TaxID=1184609 RepID=K6WLN6_9MICO|nr:copper chaperone PCu(A)C [Kineosphaera limosa]NYD99322.1 hypothetical protein [Kineosphaera limosa]GAB94721.1 hypothetical protein KILIM_010_00520 [Kineosphaera limosa NBRC 100340]
MPSFVNSPLPRAAQPTAATQAPARSSCTHRPRLRTLSSAVLALAMAPALAACTGSPDAVAPGAAASALTTYDATTPAAEATDGAGAGLEVLDAWTVARPDVAANPMTGVFGIVRNVGDHDVELVAATSSASQRAELHATVNKNGQPAMQHVEKIKVPAGGSLVLQPGGDHVMVMDLTRPIAVGDTVNVTLTTQDGGSLEFRAVAKQFAGANEPYHSGAPTPGQPTAPAPTS